MTDNSKEPAFPIVMENENQHGIKFEFVHGGLTKREHYAGLAMAAFANTFSNPYDAAAVAVKLADALLKELEASDENKA